ncbi:leucine-rich repeat protein [Paenibacillus chungangensis]|uniref:Leucine-rich repeat protein n=1 Tax=Paenibacillus chungangensis TaxID=696535 RepID=A0ABW3HWD5_9BACL
MPRRYYFARTALFAFVILLTWIGAGTNEAFANESDYEYKDVTGGVEITKYVGSARAISIPATLGGKSVVRIGRSAFYNHQLTSVIIPDSVREIRSSAFSSNKLTSVMIPINVVKIEGYAFSFNQLKRIEIGPHVSQIEDYALIHNPLERIKVDAGNSTYKDIDGKGLYSADGTLLVVGTVSGEIANSTIEIGERAFHGRGITSVTIPHFVTKIGWNSFKDNQLTHLEIPASVTEIDMAAFSNNNLAYVDIGENVTRIGNGAFQDNQLTHVEIPDRVETIGYSAFSDNLLTHVKLGAMVDGISGSAFNRNPLENIELAEGNSNFQLAANGQALYSPDGQTLIFGTISGEIREGTTEIGNSAFGGRGLEEITIPASVTTIDHFAFSYNELSRVDILDGVQKISPGAFRNNQIKVMRIGKDVQNLTADPFSHNPLENITVDENNSAYKDLDGKGMYTKDGQTLVIGTINGGIEEGTTEIGQVAFYGRGLEGNLSIPNSVTVIGGGAFAINKIKRVTIPASVKMIQSGAFRFDDGLVIIGVRGTAAEEYARDDRIPFLAADERLIVWFQFDGSFGKWREQAATKVIVYSLEEYATEQYYTWTNDENPPFFDETTWTSFSSGQELSKTDVGEWYLHIYAKDFANQEVYRSSKVFRVVDFHPVIHVSTTVGDAGTPYYEGEWINQQVRMTIRAEDMNMQELRIKLNHDGDEDEFIVGSEDDYAFERTFTESGIYQLEITATDEAGQTSIETYTIKISLDELRLDVELEQADGANYASGDWTQQGVTASVYARHAQGLTVTSSVYSLDEGESWHPFSDNRIQLDFSEEGSHSISLKAQDEAGNQVEEDLVINIDKTAPLIELTPNGNDPGVPQEKVATMVTVTDADSGVDPSALQYVWSTNENKLEDDFTVNWQSFQSGDMLKRSNGTGVWYLHIQAIDVAGNKSYIISEAFTLLDEAPEAPTWPGGSVLTVTDITQTSVKLSWSEAMDNVGVAGYRIYVDVDNWIPHTVSASLFEYTVLNLHAGTTYTFTVKAFEEAGNESAPLSKQATTARSTEEGGGSDGDLGDGEGRVLSNNANLADLQVWSGGKPLKLSPAFDSGTTEYTTRTEAVQVELIAEEAHSAAKVIRNDKVMSDRIKVDLEEGENTLILTVQAENGIKKNYTLTIYRENPKPIEPDIEFTDITGHWVESDIKRAMAKGIVSGYPGEKFRPNHPVTRAEFTVMLTGALQLEEEGATLTFIDHDQIGNWAKQAVAQAVQAGIVDGYNDGSFRPNAQITRVEMAAMIARALKLQLNTNATTGFADDEAIPEWAKGAVEAIRKLGLADGRGDNRFVPNETATRAEATVMLLRMLEQQQQQP